MKLTGCTGALSDCAPVRETSFHAIKSNFMPSHQIRNALEFLLSRAAAGLRTQLRMPGQSVCLGFHWTI
jgi:hypothetical protein